MFNLRKYVILENRFTSVTVALSIHSIYHFRGNSYRNNFYLKHFSLPTKYRDKMGEGMLIFRTCVHLHPRIRHNSGSRLNIMYIIRNEILLQTTIVPSISHTNEINPRKRKISAEIRNTQKSRECTWTSNSGYSRDIRTTQMFCIRLWSRSQILLRSRLLFFLLAGVGVLQFAFIKRSYSGVNKCSTQLLRSGFRVKSLESISTP